MSQTPYYDISGLNSEEQHKLLDAAAEDCDWMLQVHSPGKEAYHTLCLWFKDGDADEFRLLLRSLYINRKSAFCWPSSMKRITPCNRQISRSKAKPPASSNCMRRGWSTSERYAEEAGLDCTKL